MANLTKRIIDLQTTSTLGSDDYVMVDGATNGTKKYLLKGVLDEIEGIKEGTALATGAVTTDKLAAGAVTNAKIGDGAVDTTNIADDAVTAAKIDDGAVGTDALAANAVTGAKIATGAVGTGNIASGAVTLDKIASDSNATSSRNGLMSSADKAKLDGFSAASNYALKSDIVGAYIFKGSVNTENDLPSTGLTVGDVYNIIAASSYGESGANVAWTGSAWDALGESFDISDGAIDTEQLANGAVTNGKLADEAKTTISPTAASYDDPTYGSGTRQGYDAAFGNSGQTIRLPKVSSSLLIDVENIPTIPEKKIGYGAITANKIAAGAVGTEKLANSAVNTDKLATAAVSTDKIASLAVTTNKIAAGAVDNSKLANNAVGTAQIVNGAVTSEKLDSDIIDTIDSKAAASDVTALQEYIDEELENNIPGAADTLMGDPSESTWLQRESTGSGMARVESVQGAAVVWNQMVPMLNNSAWLKSNNVSVSVDSESNSVTLTSTSDSVGTRLYRLPDAFVPTAGHVFYVACEVETNADYAATFGIYATNGMIAAGLSVEAGTPRGRFATIATASSVGYIAMRLNNQTTSGYSATYKDFEVIDLTQMFGSGNEPQSVAEFEAMYPEAYYPYSAPTLKPVQIAGIKSVGFNLCDEEWELGTIDNTTGENKSAQMTCRIAGYIQVTGGMTYYMMSTLPTSAVTYLYDADKNYLGSLSSSWLQNSEKMIPVGVRYIRMRVGSSSTPITSVSKGSVCINVSNPALNGQYKPYMNDSIEWETQTLRAAGSVADELTSDKLVTRVGVVDLGTLTWVYNSTASHSNFYTAGLKDVIAKPSAITVIANIRCSKYESVRWSQLVSNGQIAEYINGWVAIIDSSYTDAADFKEAMNGVLLFYELNTPTTQPITPALPMSYKVEQGGTESIIVPDGEISAPPMLTVAEGESAADVVMDALACIATPDGPVATANHAIGTYLTMQGKLYKVTTAIAAGETIAAGTNVTQTTVMDELIALTA